MPKCIDKENLSYRLIFLGPPDMPFVVTIDVTGTNSVTARLQISEIQDLPIFTKFKIQWSTKEDFSVICGEHEILDIKQKECNIKDLQQGQKYYFRAAFGNLKGYSRFCVSTPACVTPNSEFCILITNNFLAFTLICVTNIFLNNIDSHNPYHHQ